LSPDELKPTASQKSADLHDTELSKLNPVAVADWADHEVPSHTFASPLPLTATQKSADAHDTDVR
jgi:hypothetical protein